MSRSITRPFLAENATDAEIAKILADRRELWAFVKVDGIRGFNLSGGMRSRSMKVFPNIEFNTRFNRGDLAGLDGELCFGKPNDPALCRNTASAVSTVRGPADGIHWHVFDDFSIDAPYRDRYASAKARLEALALPFVSCMKAHPVHSMAELKALEQRAVYLNGFEGLIVRDPAAPYKEGRSTVREGFMLKVKRFVDSEAIIEDFKELMSNQNEAFENELGLTSRSNAKAGMVGQGVLGSFIARDVKTGIVTSVGGGLSADERKLFWEVRETLVGKQITYKSLPIGVKEKPRHTSFVSFRDKKVAG